MAINNEIVVKSNELIQKSKISLTLTQQRLINYAISLIDRSKESIDYIDIDTRKLAKVLQVSEHNFTFFRAEIKKIKDSESIEIFINGRYAPLCWLDDYEVIPQEQTIRIWFGKRIKPYLINLRKNFTQSQLKVYLSFKCVYSSIIYDLLKSIAAFNFSKTKDYIYQYNIELDDLREKLGIKKDSYKNFSDFRRFVLLPSLEEISKHSDIVAYYDIIKKGRKVNEIIFTVQLKSPAERISI